MNSAWHRRIQRAQELLDRHAFAKEILGFYIQVARFQESLHDHLKSSLSKPAQLEAIHLELTVEELSALSSRFAGFLSVVEGHGPHLLAKLSEDLRASDPSKLTDLLSAAWSAPSPLDAPTFLAQAFLQPYAELLRERTKRVTSQPQGARFKLGSSGDFAICPFCVRKPCMGVLRQLGEGAARSMVCSFCLTEWDFRRLVCPGCGEENDTKLPVFTADDFDCIRVECCETCKTYIKTVDLTKDGHAEPIVDELASAPLDLWAREHGYAKLHANLLGM